MPKIALSLTEQSADLRSNESAYKFCIENHGSSAINLIKLTPRIPKNVDELKIINPALEDVRTKYDRLCSELSLLVNDHLAVYSKELRDKHKEITIEYVNDIMGGIVGPAKYFMKRLQGYYQKKLEEAESYSASLLVTIENSTQAQDSLAFFKEDDDLTGQVVQIYKTKLKYLCELEDMMANEPDSRSLATIQPDSIYTVTYVLRFPRSYIDSNRYNMDIEVAFQEKGKTEKHISSASAVVVISPKPFVVTMIAVFASILGVVLKVAMESTDQGFTIFYQSAFNALIGAAGITSIVLAIIFYNIYEFTDLGKNIKMGVGWRSALLIGALCGLLGDRVLNSIQAFFKP